MNEKVILGSPKNRLLILNQLFVSTILYFSPSVISLAQPVPGNDNEINQQAGSLYSLAANGVNSTNVSPISSAANTTLNSSSNPNSIVVGTKKSGKQTKYKLIQQTKAVKKNSPSAPQSSKSNPRPTEGDVPAQEVPSVQQPTTYVESAPAAESNVEQYRKERLEIEANTDRQVIEMLERQRLEDEKKRLEKLMDKSNVNVNEESPKENEITPNAPNNGVLPQPQPVAPPPAQDQQNTPANVQMIQVIQESPSKNNDSQLKSVDEDLDQSKVPSAAATGAASKNSADRTDSREEKADSNEGALHRFYLSGGIGSASYIGVSNVQGNMSATASMGYLLESGFTVEASLNYSNFFIDERWWNYPYFKEMDQYSLGLGAKYQFLNFGIIKPSIGGLVAYTYRKYFDRGYYSYVYSNSSEVSSQAVDIGLTLGVDVDLSDRFALGVEYRYMTNLSNRTDSEYLNSSSVWQDGQPVERTDYSLISLVCKFRF